MPSSPSLPGSTPLGSRFCEVPKRIGYAHGGRSVALHWRQKYREEHWKMASPWSGDWRQRLFEELERRGFARLTDFATHREGSTLFEMARELAEEGIAPVQLEQVLREEATSEEQFSYFARTVLARYLRHELPDGWKRHGEFRLSLTLGTWVSSLGKGRGTAGHTVARRLRERSDLPDDWLPVGADDPAIIEVFSGVTIPPLPTR